MINENVEHVEHVATQFFFFIRHSIFALVILIVVIVVSGVYDNVSLRFDIDALPTHDIRNIKHSESICICSVRVYPNTVTHIQTDKRKKIIYSNFLYGRRWAI